MCQLTIYKLNHVLCFPNLVTRDLLICGICTQDSVLIVRFCAHPNTPYQGGYKS